MPLYEIWETFSCIVVGIGVTIGVIAAPFLLVGGICYGICKFFLYAEKSN